MVAIVVADITAMSILPIVVLVVATEVATTTILDSTTKAEIMANIIIVIAVVMSFEGIRTSTRVRNLGSKGKRRITIRNIKNYQTTHMQINTPNLGRYWILIYICFILFFSVPGGQAIVQQKNCLNPLHI